MDKPDIVNIENSIYFLKVDELKLLLDEAGLKANGTKQALIDAMLSFVKNETVENSDDNLSSIVEDLKRNRHSYDANIHIIPGIYKNNRVYRQRFKHLIGEHFFFTSYGMDWIKQQWQQGVCPTQTDFANYWQQEYTYRKTSQRFESKKTLQRVIFFRKMKHKKLSKQALEDAWVSERKSQAERAKKLIMQSIHERKKLKFC